MNLQSSSPLGVAAKLDNFITQLSTELKPIVTEIEASIPITQNHYGAYMNAINQLAKGDVRVARMMALAMMRAGGNKDGINAAMKFIS